MPWTCQTESGPLWWKLQWSEHWYRCHTDPSILVNDYLLMHLHHLGQPLVLKWWKDWGVVEYEVRIEAGYLLEVRVEEMAAELLPDRAHIRPGMAGVESTRAIPAS